ncbi:hypothetical protein PAXRUDRAFT_740777 [Paxillus rubicundulus Ve08.2h10]|uniref:Uncharacterized protein n=1 Tax=Paxillus rubicundulus Ve08.2h10 TaxID=930991 RepID=A0A0D0E6F7_9AGAM|nr:hypothetical protein PAXRUDRAFT_740777 [Paxillus rubicundulus Ve08.2h10]
MCETTVSKQPIFASVLRSTRLYRTSRGLTSVPISLTLQRSTGKWKVENLQSTRGYDKRSATRKHQRKRGRNGERRHYRSYQLDQALAFI